MKHPEFTMSMFASKEDLYKAKAEYFEGLANTFIKEIGDPLGEIYIVVSERDHHDPLKSRGAIAMETYTGQANLINAVDAAKRFSGRNGKATICKLVPVGGIETCEKIINSSY